MIQNDWSFGTHSDDSEGRSCNSNGGLAQLGERLHGMQEVIGSIPLSSTLKKARNSL